MTDHKPVRILLIEDDEISTFLFKRIVQFRWPSAQIDVCHSGESALRMLADPRTVFPQIIVSDLNLSGMNGFEFIAEFQKSALNFTHNIQLVIATSSLQPEDREKAKALNVLHYLIKPLTVESLLPVMDLARIASGQ